MGSPTFQQVLLKLLGSDEEVTIAKEIQKAVKQTPGVYPRAPTSLPGPGVTRQTNSVLCFNCGRWGHIPVSFLLPFISPFPCVQAQGTKVFSLVLSSSKNAFVFPSFTVIGSLLKFLALQRCSFTMIAPDVSPRKYWWPLLQRQATVAFKLGQKGDNSILLFPA